MTVALPLAQMGVTSGGRFYLNVVRRSGSSDDQPMWSPSFGEFEAPAALRELTLDAADTIPANLPTGEEFQRLDAQGLVARWKLDERQGVAVYSTDGDLTGKLVNGASRERLGTRSVVRLQDSRQQYVDFGSAKAFDLTGPLTLLVWAKYEPTETWYPALLGKGYEADRHLRDAHPPRRHRVVRAGRPRRHAAHPQPHRPLPDAGAVVPRGRHVRRRDDAGVPQRPRGGCRETRDHDHPHQLGTAAVRLAGVVWVFQRQRPGRERVQPGPDQR